MRMRKGLRFVGVLLAAVLLLGALDAVRKPRLPAPVLPLRTVARHRRKRKCFM